MSALVITGRMQRNAETRCTADGHYQLYVRVDLPAPAGAKPLTVRAMQAFGYGPAAGFAAHASAKHLRSGARVTLHAGAISWRRGVAHIDGLELLAMPDLPNTQPHEVDR